MRQVKRADLRRGGETPRLGRRQVAASSGQHGIALEKCRFNDQGIGAANRPDQRIDFLGIADDREARARSRRSFYGLGIDSLAVRQHD